MDFSCESLDKYQYSSHDEWSKHIAEEFNFLLNTLNEAKPSVLSRKETVRRIYCLACILWQSQDTAFGPAMISVLRDDVFDVLVDRTLNMPQNRGYDYIKVAVDRVLCSMCYIKPDFYDTLLMRLRIVPKNQGCENVYTFRHVIPYSEDINALQPSAPVDLKSITLSNNMLKSLSVISLSCVPAYKLVHTHFLAVLVDLVIDFIVRDENSSPSLLPSAGSNTGIANAVGIDFSVLLGLGLKNANRAGHSVAVNPHGGLPHSDVSTTDLCKINMERVCAILNFFAELCWQNVLKNWFITEKNSILWSHLIRYLCITLPKSQRGVKYMLDSKPNAKLVRMLEDSTINFFSKCCCGHFQNQEKFSEIFSNFLKNVANGGMDLPGISYFMRRILIEMIISPGHIYVSVETDLPEGINKTKTTDISLLLPPPAFPTSKRHQLLYLNVDRTCADILKKIRTMPPAGDEGENSEVQFNKNKKIEEKTCISSTSKQIEDSIPSTSKRFMDDCSVPQAKKNCNAQNDQLLHKLMLWAPQMNQFININQYWTISEILQIFVPSGDEIDFPVLKFLLSEQELYNDEHNFGSNNLSPPPALLKFVSLKGFELLVANIEKKAVLSAKKPSTNSRSAKRGHSCAVNLISARALLALGQFSRLPDYRNNQHTKLVQGSIGLGKETYFHSDKHRGLFSQDVTKLYNPLAVLPFELLRLTLCESYRAPISDNSEIDIKYIPAIDFVLIYLNLCTHERDSKDFDTIQKNIIYKEAIQQCYWNKYGGRSSSTRGSCWPKGTGYSTAYTGESLTLSETWKIEEEELVSTLLTVIGNYVCPYSYIQSDVFAKSKTDIANMLYMRHLPSLVVTQIQKSCLLPLIKSYLSNDSVLDIVKHIALYRAIMLVIRAMVSNVQLSNFILITFENVSQEPEILTSTEESISDLMIKLQSHINDYLRRCGKVNESGVSSSSAVLDDSDIQEQSLFRDICDTADIIQEIRRNCSVSKSITNSTSNDIAMPQNINNVTEVMELSVGSEFPKDYVKIMKNLQFDQYEMITEAPNGSLEFKVAYHFRQLALRAPAKSSIKRLAMEMGSLASSLPISQESSIFLRHDESRIDVIKVLITGPAGTPYMNGCFEFDIICPANYPNSPIKVNFQTTGGGSVRFNPNLYDCGKVCLSLLGTWSGETWNPTTSSILQVLVSIQGMILVSEPYFNEPGYEAKRGTREGDTSSKAYNYMLLPSTIRYAMTHQILYPNPCFQKVIHTHFWLKKDEIKAQVNNWISQIDGTRKHLLQAEANILFRELDSIRI